MTLPWNKSVKTLKVQDLNNRTSDVQACGVKTIMFGSFVVPLEQTEEVNMASYTEGTEIPPSTPRQENAIVPFVTPAEVNPADAAAEPDKTKASVGDGPWTRSKAKQAANKEEVDKEPLRTKGKLPLTKEKKGKTPLYNDGESLFSEEDFPSNKSENSSPSPKESVMVANATDLEEVVR